jgi:DNA-binding LacI/PurR family transcriptional regulator
MGKIAAQTLLDRIEERTNFVPEIAVAPELIKRHSVVPSRSL